MLPSGSGIKTGWEDLGVLDSLRVLAGFHESKTVYQKFRMPERVEEDEITEDRRVVIRHHQLETFGHLPKILRAIFPTKLRPTRRESPYPVPPPSHVRETPGRWSRPREVTPRLIRRAYQRLFESLNWVRPVYLESGGTKAGRVETSWVKCTFEQMRMWESGGKGGIDGKVAMAPTGTAKWAVASEKEVRWIQEAASTT